LLLGYRSRSGLSVEVGQAAEEEERLPPRLGKREEVGAQVLGKGPGIGVLGHRRGEEDRERRRKGRSHGSGIGERDPSDT
jgi:hypothetical protein